MRQASGTWLHRILVVQALVLAAPAARVASAGECIDGMSGQMHCLETGRGLDGRPCEKRMALACLSCEHATNYYTLDRWAGPASAQILRSRRESPHKAKLKRALLPLLDARGESPAARRLGYDAARVLACHGVGHLGDHDIFEILTSVARTPFPALASLADPRTVDFLEERYAEFVYVGREGLEWQEERRWLTSLLNCLYHLPGKPAVALAQRIASWPGASAEIVERARRVIERPPAPGASSVVASPAQGRTPED